MAYSENTVIDEGTAPNGVRTRLHFEGDSLITQHTYDATPHLEYARQAREATAGQRWGEGKLVGHIPAAEYARFLAIRDNADRQKAILTWLRENPAFRMFDRGIA